MIMKEREGASGFPFVKMVEAFVKEMESKNLHIKGQLNLSVIGLKNSIQEPDTYVRYMKDALRRGINLFFIVAETEKDLEKGRLVIKALCSREDLVAVDEHGNLMETNPRVRRWRGPKGGIALIVRAPEEPKDTVH